MATYQEQIAKYEAGNATKALVAMAELGRLGDALAILEREKIIDADLRIAYLKMYVLQHPEISERLKKYRGELSAAEKEQQEKP